MSFSVKGYSGYDSDRPPNYCVVDESEVVVKDREIRFQRPEVLLRFVHQAVVILKK